MLHNAFGGRGFTGRQRSMQSEVDPVTVCKRLWTLDWWP